MNVQLDPAQPTLPGTAAPAESEGSFGTLFSTLMKSGTGEESGNGSVTQPMNAAGGQNGTAQAVASKQSQAQPASQSTKPSGTRASKTASREEADVTPVPSTEVNLSALLVNPLAISPLPLNSQVSKPAERSTNGDTSDPTAAKAISLPLDPAAAPVSAPSSNPRAASGLSLDAKDSASTKAGPDFSGLLGPAADPPQPALEPGGAPAQPPSGHALQSASGDSLQLSSDGNSEVQLSSDGNSQASTGKSNEEGSLKLAAQNQQGGAGLPSLSVPPLPALQQTEIRPLPEAASPTGAGAAALAASVSAITNPSGLAVAQEGSLGEGSLRKAGPSALANQISAVSTKTGQNLTEPGTQKSVTGKPSFFASDEKADGRKNSVGNKTNTSEQHQNGGQQPNAAHGGSAETIATQEVSKHAAHQEETQVSAALSQNLSSQATNVQAKSASTTQPQTLDRLSASVPADAQPSPLTRATDMVQTARLVHGLSGSELHVGVQVGEFGRVDIHTIATQTQVAARIYVEHNDLVKALATDLAPLHEKLATEHRVNASVELLQTGTQGSDSSQRQQQQARAPGKATVLPASDDAVEASETNPDLMSVTSDLRLSMHA